MTEHETEEPGTTPLHWHSAQGVPSYGPDGSGGWPSYMTHREFADGVRDDLWTGIEFLQEQVSFLLEQGGDEPSKDQLEALWGHMAHLRRLDDEHTWWAAKDDQWDLSFWSTEEGQEALRKQIEARAAEHLPIPIHSGASIYGWPCVTSNTTSRCDHLDDIDGE